MIFPEARFATIRFEPAWDNESIAFIYLKHFGSLEPSKPAPSTRFPFLDEANLRLPQ